MCGISGLLKLDGSQSDPNQISRMIAALHHRGPDARGSYVSGSVGRGMVLQRAPIQK